MAKKKAKIEDLTYQPEVLDSELERELKKHEARAERGGFGSLLTQVESEYQLSLAYMRPKFDEWALRLKLYNNQKRDKAAIGDPLMFTIHQTMLASLYSDRLVAEFQGREQGDQDKAENWNALAQFDEDGMMKPQFDYEFDWDASFFGRGIALFMDFDREQMLPIPEVIDPMTWLRDPRAKSVRGDARGRGQMRFGGREIRLTGSEMDELGVYFNRKGLKTDGVDISSLFDKNAQLRAEAQGMGDISKYDVKGDNAEYRLLEWFTRWNGKRVLVTLSSDRKRVVRFQKLNDPRFPLLDRTIYPIAHDWDGVSIPDLTEDKQRGRSVVQNLGIRLIKRELSPRYLYDTNKIPNRADLDREEDKHIPVDGDPNNSIIVAPSAAVKQEAQWILDVLDGAAQRATATPEIQQGVASQDKRTLGEINLVASKVDTRYSLSAKIFGWSEKVYWQMYVGLYGKHFKNGIDEKTIRIKGSMGNTWKSLKRSDLIGNQDPDIDIESKVISDAKRLEKFGLARQFVKDARELQPDSVNIRTALRWLGKLAGFSRDEIAGVLPPNVDELDADDENEMLNRGEKAEVKATDDHALHLEIHAKADETPQKMAHIEAHRKGMLLKRDRPDLPFLQPPPQGDPAQMDNTDFKVAQAANAGTVSRP